MAAISCVLTTNLHVPIIRIAFQPKLFATVLLNVPTARMREIAQVATWRWIIKLLCVSFLHGFYRLACALANAWGVSAVTVYFLTIRCQGFLTNSLETLPKC